MRRQTKSSISQLPFAKNGPAVACRRFQCAWACLALALLSGQLGCQAKSEMYEEEPIKMNLRQISKAYFAHLGFHQATPTPEQLREGVHALHALDMGSPVDQAMVSPRDKQPIVVVYGAKGAAAEAILAYEKLGVDGKRWVVTMRQEIKELPDDEFKKAVFPNGHKPEMN